MNTKSTLKMVITISFIFSAVLSNAQVTIGSGRPPSSFALLDLDTYPDDNTVGGKKGLHLPRLTMAERTALQAEFSDTGNRTPEGLAIYNTTSNCVEFWDSGTWRSFCENTRWFYMPSIVMDVTTSGTFFRDLHLEYKKQFADNEDVSTPPNSSIAGTALVKSDVDAPNPFEKIYAANELYFYITGYDTTVFSNLSITSTGILTYTVNASNVTDATYMNIVFMIK